MLFQLSLAGWCQSYQPPSSSRLLEQMSQWTVPWTTLKNQLVSPGIIQWTWSWTWLLHGAGATMRDGSPQICCSWQLLLLQYRMRGSTYASQGDTVRCRCDSLLVSLYVRATTSFTVEAECASSSATGVIESPTVLMAPMKLDVVSLSSHFHQN